MSASSSGKKGAYKKKAAAPEEAMEQRRQQLATLQQQCAAVERMLAVCSDQHRRLDAEVCDVQRQLAQTRQQVDDADGVLDEHVSVMRNMAKLSSDQLRQRHDALQKTVTDAVKENDALRSAQASELEAKRSELRHWTALVDDEQQRIDQKALQLGLQLKTALACVPRTGAVR